MSKKDKKIEDATVEANGQKYEGYRLSIGKKVIGEVAEISDNQFAVLKNGNAESFYKNVEKAVGNIIENYNLSH